MDSSYERGIQGEHEWYPEDITGEYNTLVNTLVFHMSFSLSEAAAFRAQHNVGWTGDIFILLHQLSCCWTIVSNRYDCKCASPLGLGV